MSLSINYFHWMIGRCTTLLCAVCIINKVVDKGDDFIERITGITVGKLIDKMISYLPEIPLTRVRRIGKEIENFERPIYNGIGKDAELFSKR